MPDIRHLPAVTNRVETGAVQFGDDWPGLFIRGDNCIFYAMVLESIIREVEALPPTTKMVDYIARLNVKGLAEMLGEPIVHPHKEDIIKKFQGLSDLT